MSALAEALVAAQRPQDEPPRLLAEPCLACNREAGEPMCTLCDAMTRAEEEAERGPAEAAVRGQTMTGRAPWFPALGASA